MRRCQNCVTVTGSTSSSCRPTIKPFPFIEDNEMLTKVFFLSDGRKDGLTGRQKKSSSNQTYFRLYRIYKNQTLYMYKPLAFEIFTQVNTFIEICFLRSTKLYDWRLKNLAVVINCDTMKALLSGLDYLFESLFPHVYGYI